MWRPTLKHNPTAKKPVRNRPSTGIEHEDETMFAVIKTGGKQYRVALEDKLKVEKVAGNPGDVVEFGEVLVVGGDTPTLGTPTVAGAIVAGEVLEQGHRQEFTLVRITEILTEGKKPSQTPPPRPKREKPVPKAEAEAEATP
jgi:large subunit ribosomal protein L21